MTEQFYVNYSIVLAPDSTPRHYQAGPYQEWFEARSHLQDIKSFAGVSNCWIGNTRDPARLLVNGNSE